MARTMCRTKTGAAITGRSASIDLVALLAWSKPFTPPPLRRGEMHGELPPTTHLIERRARRAVWVLRSRISQSAGAAHTRLLSLARLSDFAFSRSVRFPTKASGHQGGIIMSTYGVDGPIPQASLHHLAAMLRSAVDAIISIDAAGTIESVNPATEKLFGYAAGELVGRNVKMLMPEPYRSQHDGYIRHYRHTGLRKIIGIGREVVGQRKDGSTFPMHLSVSEYEIDGTRHFAGIVHDLTAQRQGEAESMHQQTLFRAIINDAPQAIIIADRSRNIFLVNPAVRRIFGYGPEELIGKHSRIVYAGDEDYSG